MVGAGIICYLNVSKIGGRLNAEEEIQRRNFLPQSEITVNGLKLM